MRTAFSAVATPSTWIRALCAALSSSLLLSASAMGECPNNYPADRFRVCFYDGTDPTTGAYLGSELEPPLGKPVPARAFGINRDWGSGEIYAGLTGNISAVWRGRLRFGTPSAGDDRHLVSVYSSDGVRVYVDEALVLDEWSNQKFFNSFVIGHEFPGTHDIRIEWFEGSQSWTQAHLRFHWDRVPEVYQTLDPAITQHEIQLDVFVLKEMQVCIAGLPWDGNPGEALCPKANEPTRLCDETDQFRLLNQDDSTHLAWQLNPAPAPAERPVVLKPSDPIPPELTLVECIHFGFSDAEIAALLDPETSPVYGFANSLPEWTFGALVVDPVEIHVIDPGEFTMTRGGKGLWVDWPDFRDAAAPGLTPATDFIFGVHSYNESADDPDLPDPDNIRRHTNAYGGATLGLSDTRLTGTGTSYSWVPDRFLRSDLYLIHEWTHQMGSVISQLMSQGSVASHPDPPPGCGNMPPGASSPLDWWPNTDRPTTDPDAFYCDNPLYVQQRPITAHTLVYHFDPTLDRYALPFLTGNHCDNGILDDGVPPGGNFGETAVDLGATCHWPTVSISSPDDGSSIKIGRKLRLRAVATDPVQGDLTENLEWESDLDGVLGTGGNIVTTLTTAGEHRITASVANSEGVAGFEVITVTATIRGYGRKGFKR